MSVNMVLVSGNLTRDPEVRGNGTVTSFTVAANEKFKNKSGEWQEKVEFVNCVAFGKTGELVAQYLSKGSACFVQGRLQSRSYEDKDGNKKYVTEVVADRVEFLGGKQDNTAKTDRPSTRNSYEDPPFNPDDDIPF